MKITEITEDTESDQIKSDIIASEQQERRKLLTEYVGIELFAKEHCRPYLKEIGGFENAVFRYPLCRGMVGFSFSPGTYSEVIDVNQNRKPTDTPEGMQVLIDDWFQSNFGTRFRQTSLHVTGNIVAASTYAGAAGPVVIIPMGEYHYAYSEKYTDLFKELVNVNIQVPRKMSPEGTLQYYRTIVNEFMNKGEYKSDIGLLHAIQKGHEIMVSCQKALAIQHKFLYDLVRKR